MSDHQLEAGKRIINVLALIGTALGYTVRQEMPVQRRSKASAVDVAWFKDDELQYPLMIFEVESSASNTMAANAAKVFGQPVAEFERPLFFFHIVVRSGDDTSRIDFLRGTFGSHNYRVYRIDRGMATSLVLDVLSQHRRVNRSLDVADLAGVLLSADGFETDLGTWLSHAGKIGLRGSYLADLARLSRDFPPCRDEFFKELWRQAEVSEGGGWDTGFETYLGRAWKTPILLALLCFSRPTEGKHAFEQLKTWQEHGSYLTQIGPHFGLSQDYDQFILNLAPTLWVFIVLLMRSEPAVASYALHQCLEVLRKLSMARRWSLFTAVWTLHLAATVGDKTAYDEVCEFINVRGGIGERLLYSPPGLGGSDDDPHWDDVIDDNPRPAPTLERFRERRRAEASRIGSLGSMSDIAFLVLTDERAVFVWGDDLMRGLIEAESA